MFRRGVVRPDADEDDDELADDVDESERDSFGVGLPGSLWSRSVVGGVEGLRCRAHGLLPAAH
jgi:hypothetical protein